MGLTKGVVIQLLKEKLDLSSGLLEMLEDNLNDVADAIVEEAKDRIYLNPDRDQQIVDLYG